MGLIYAKPSDNLISTASVITPSTEATGYEVENLYDGNPAKPWKMTATTGNVVFDFGSATNIDLVAIVHHNLTAGLEVRIQGNASDSWGSPTLNQTITIPAYDADSYPVNPWIDLSALSNSFRYWRLVVVGTNSANVAIGELWLIGTKRTLTARNLRYGFTDGIARPLIEHTTDYGVSTIYDLGCKMRSIAGELIVEATDLALVRAWWNDCHGRALPTLLILDDTVNECLMVRWREMARSDQRSWPTATSIPVAFSEVSRGLVL